MLGLQRAVGNAGVAAVVNEDRSPVHDVLNSGGGPLLDADTRSDAESRFGGQDYFPGSRHQEAQVTVRTPR